MFYFVWIWFCLCTFHFCDLSSSLVDLCSPTYLAMRHVLPWNSMQRLPTHIALMDPQVCPPPLSSSQSMASGLDKSPASTYRPGHSRSSSTGSSKQTKQVTGLDCFILTFSEVLHYIRLETVNCDLPNRTPVFVLFPQLDRENLIFQLFLLPSDSLFDQVKIVKSWCMCQGVFSPSGS